jgi:PAS domain S-box-containing protein
MSREFSRSGRISLLALEWRAIRPDREQELLERVMKKIAYETILDNIADGVFTVDSELKITSFNKSAEQITGVPSEEAIGRRCREVLRTNICEESCALLQTMTTGKTMLHKEIIIVRSDGRRLPIGISTAILRDKEGRLVGAVESFRDMSLVAELRRELKGRYTVEDIISKNPKMQLILKTLPQIAESGASVLIEGESGTGKEIVAHAVHNLSNRRKRPFVPIHCAAIPDTLLESELFGYKAGAFTDAKKDKPGKFTIAHRGTLFLDEIGEIQPALQVKLLRFLQDGVYEPLGAVKSVKGDLRILAASNKPLSQLVTNGLFRQDLYYRINVVKITLPPLRERMDDLPLLIDHFIERFNRLKGKNIHHVSPETFGLLVAHDYPGNIRELENIIEHGFVMCRGETMKPEHLPPELAHDFGDRRTGTAREVPLKDLEARYIWQALRRHNWNRLETARSLGMSKSTFFRKVKALGIELPRKDGRYS